MNHLAAEQLIKARLSEKVSQIPDKNILSAADLNGVKEKTQVNPALHVIYAGDNVTVSNKVGSGKAQAFNQLWQITLVVRNVRDVSGESSRQDAGEIIDTVLKALQGWKPSITHSELQRNNSPYKPTYRNGFAYFSFQFSTQMTTIGQGNG